METPGLVIPTHEREIDDAFVEKLRQRDEVYA
jgi:hypothetical protein